MLCLDINLHNYGIRELAIGMYCKALAITHGLVSVIQVSVRVRTNSTIPENVEWS